MTTVDPSTLEVLQKKVVESGADIGVAFDGDGDRLIAVDEKGNVATGDQVLAVCAKYMKEKGLLKGKPVISTVMSNMGLGVSFKKIGYTTCDHESRGPVCSGKNDFFRSRAGR